MLGSRRGEGSGLPARAVAATGASTSAAGPQALQTCHDLSGAALAHTEELLDPPDVTSSAPGELPELSLMPQRNCSSNARFGRSDILLFHVFPFGSFDCR